MLDIVAITAPIYFMIALGFVLTRFGLFAKADMRVFGKFVINLAMPMMLFRALSRRSIDEILNPDYLIAYALGSLAVIVLGYRWCRSFSREEPTRATFYVLGMSASNSGFIGFPILLLTFAPIAGASLALNMIVENLLVLPLLLFMAERGKNGAGASGWRSAMQPFMRLLRNPLIISLLTALAVSASGMQLPEPVTRGVDMLANTSSALSLFVIGGTLVGLRLRGEVWKSLPVVVGKLIGHPLAVMSMIMLLPWLGLPPMDPQLAMAAIIMAAMPMASIYATLAQAYGHEEFAALTLLVCIVLSFFSITLWLLLLSNVSWFAKVL